MSEKPSPLFLERRSYRQRRLTDAARLIPVLGAVLWGIPLLWQRGPEGIATSTAILYIFGVWLALAWLALMVSRNLDEDAETDPDGGEGRS
ncbi:hypothetical protein [Lacimonas salitolerans]|uniref:DUF3311 domain-containing protein n=1 Tax=Lacimonas salitolerans TaxID=1323750 RepID=A0ABW4EEF4_9RHOB